jgi:hypothetical protein
MATSTSHASCECDPDLGGSRYSVHVSEHVRPGFGDTVRIAGAPETTSRGFAGRTGSVFGESVPSSSGVGPVIGDRGDDFALSVLFADTDEQEWFAPHLIEFVDHGGEQVMSLEGGPTFVRDAAGDWHQEGPSTPEGKILDPGRPIPYEAAASDRDATGFLSRLFRRQSKR